MHWKPFRVSASVFAKHLGRWSMLRPWAALHEAVLVPIVALLECALHSPEEGGYVGFICSLKINPALIAQNTFLVHVWRPVLLGESGVGCIVQVEIKVQLMKQWKVEWSHPSFQLGFVSLQGWLCLVMALLSRWLCDAEFLFSQWSMPHFLGWSCQHRTWDLDFSRLQALSRPPNFCQCFEWSS